MRFFVGKTAAKCGLCGCSDWRLVDAAQTFNVLSRIECTQCGAASTYADLALQTPLEPTEISSPN